MQKTASIQGVKGQEALTFITAADTRQQQFIPSTADVTEGKVVVKTDEVFKVKRLTRSGDEYYAPYVALTDSAKQERLVALSSFRKTGSYTLTDGTILEANNLVSEYGLYSEIIAAINEAQKGKKYIVLKRGYGLRFGRSVPKSFDYWEVESSK